MDKYKFSNYNEFIECARQVFPENEFLKSIPKGAENYSINTYNSLLELNNYLNSYCSNGGSYVVMSGSLGIMSSKRDLAIMFIPSIVEPFNSIILGGVFRC